MCTALHPARWLPPCRSMRQDPNPDKDPKEKTFAGDNFVRRSGDFDSFQALNLHAVQAGNRGQTVAMMVRRRPCPVPPPSQHPGTLLPSPRHHPSP